MELLKDPRWQRKRLETLERDGWKCRWCGNPKRNLQIHHKRYERGKPPWEIDSRFLITLCDKCHKKTTDLRAEATNLLAELGPDQLSFTVDMIDSWTRRGSNPLQFVLEYFADARGRIICNPYSAGASMNLEAIDALADGVFARLDAATPRTYGDTA